MYDLVDKIMAFEDGEMEDLDEIVELFQYLLDSGLVWSLQGSYGRTAAALIDAGHCSVNAAPCVNE